MVTWNVVCLIVVGSVCSLFSGNHVLSKYILCIIVLLYDDFIIL